MVQDFYGPLGLDLEMGLAHSVSYLDLIALILAHKISLLVYAISKMLWACQASWIVVFVDCDFLNDFKKSKPSRYEHAWLDVRARCESTAIIFVLCFPYKDFPCG